MFNFFVMFLVVLVAFASGFFTLYKDPSKMADFDMMDRMECIDYDKELDSFGNAFVILLEAMLAQDGEAKCYRTTSQPVVGTGMMYGFMLVGVIMMVNTLIAMMAKSKCWLCSSQSPQPHNSLQVPTLTVDLLLAQLSTSFRAADHSTCS